MWFNQPEWVDWSPTRIAQHVVDTFDTVIDQSSYARSTAPVSFQQSRVTVASVQGERDYMEDGYAVGDDFFAVLDGHGGPHAMRIAQQALNHVVRATRPVRSSDARTLVRVMRETVAQLARAVDEGQRDEHNDGCTLALVVSRRDMLEGASRDVLTVASLGDTRVLLVEAHKDAVTQVHQDHNTNNDAEVQRVERLEPLINMRLKGRLNVTRALGDREFLSHGLSRAPEISIVRAEPGDMIIVASDGVFETLNNQQIAAMLCALRDESQRRRMSIHYASVITWLALKSGSRDNITTIVYHS